MMKLIRELRRREVFRTVGLYVGISWILIEGASVMLPAFDAPDWLLRGLIIAAIAGLPVAAVLAWIYDVTEKGIEVQADPTDTIVAPLGGRKMDFVVIGVLAVALTFSVYLNISNKGSVIDQVIEPISVLIADFDNRTGDELFDGTLEQALQIGIESASFIAGYRRDAARKLAATMSDSEDGVLDEKTARLVSVREGVRLVMAGSIEEDNGSYTLYVRAVDPINGEVLTSAKVNAKSKLDVLAAVGNLAGELREGLGDDDIDRTTLITKETFTAASLEAAQAYSKAQSLQYNGRYEEAMRYYREALQFDPEFGRAYSGLALSANALGLTEESNELWAKALEKLDTMTERERLRTLGLYYSLVTRNFGKAIETYETLVKKYPADDTAHNGLAVQYFYSLDFASALDAGRQMLDIYPNSVMGRSNYALYAMYASDFETAVSEAGQVRKLDPAYFKAWLPIAMQQIDEGDFDSAQESYASMAEASSRGALTASLGLADLFLFRGDIDAAIATLEAGIASSEEAGSQYYLATHRIALAEALLRSGREQDAMAQIDAALEASTGLQTQVPAALLYLDAGQTEQARQIAATLGASLQPQNRAYGKMLDGLIALTAGDHVAAVDTISAALQFADLWLVRFSLGKAYLAAGFNAEALDEFTAAAARRGEATAVFLDDLPTYRYLSPLPYWQGRVQMSLGMTDAAKRNLALFIDRRPSDDPLAADARQRMN